MIDAMGPKAIHDQVPKGTALSEGIYKTFVILLLFLVAAIETSVKMLTPSSVIYLRLRP